MAYSNSLSQYMSHEFAKHLPWNNVNPDDLGQVVVEFVKSQDIYYRRWALKWFENFQFLFGNQNVKWSKRYDYATDFDFLRAGSGSSSFGQKSFTNITRTSLEALMSVMFGSMPDWDVETMSESSVMGKRLKHICVALMDAYAERLKMQSEYQVYAATFGLFGAACIKMDWDANAGTIIDIPKFQKVMRPLITNVMQPDMMTGGLIESPANYLGTDGQPVFQKQWAPILDNTGKPVFEKVFAGDVRCQILSPFQYRRPLGSYGPQRDKYFQEIRILDYDEWLDEYGKVEGKTKQWNRVKPIYTDAAMWSFAVQQWQRMQLTTPPVITDLLNRQPGVARLTQLKSKVIVIEHYDKPHAAKWPMGRRLVISNGLCTHVTTPQYNTNKIDGWHPYSEAQWMRVAPSNLSPGPINDVVQKNKELNVTDTLISTAMRRNLGSQLLFKKGAGFDPDQFTGEPGATMEVNDPFAAKWLHDDMPIPPVVFQLRGTFKDDAYEMSGAGDALRGERSPGATSGYQAKQYEEREQKRLTVARSNFDSGVSGSGEKLLCCLKSNVTHLDDYTIGFLKRSAAGKFTVSDAITFLTSPLDFGVDVKVKKMSMAFKSKATQQADIREMAQGPLQQRLAQDANVLDEYIKFFDVGDVLRDGSAVQRDRASRENETFLDLLRLGPNDDGVKLPIVIFEDDDDLHADQHLRMYVENFDEISNNEYVHQQFLLHMEVHRIQKKEKQGEVTPGTRLLAPQSYAVAQQQPKMDFNQVMGQNQQMQQMKMQQQQMGQQPGQGPQAPAPSGAGKPGQATVNPGAQADQTPTGSNPATSGGSMQ